MKKPSSKSKPKPNSPSSPPCVVEAWNSGYFKPVFEYLKGKTDVHVEEFLELRDARAEFALSLEDYPNLRFVELVNDKIWLYSRWVACVWWGHGRGEWELLCDSNSNDYELIALSPSDNIASAYQVFRRVGDIDAMLDYMSKMTVNPYDLAQMCGDKPVPTRFTLPSPRPEVRS